MFSNFCKIFGRNDDVSSVQPMKTEQNNNSVQYREQAVPITADNLSKLFETLTFSNDQMTVVLYLINSIESIHDKDFLNLMKNCYNDALKFATIDALLPRVVGLEYTSLLEIIRWIIIDEKQIAFIKRYKNELMNSNGFNLDLLLKIFKRKTSRNHVREIFGLPKEFIADRGNGIEIFGIFYPESHFANNEEHKFVQNGKKTVTVTIKCRDTERHNDKYYVDVEVRGSNGFSQRGSSISLNGVWIIDNDGHFDLE